MILGACLTSAGCGGRVPGGPEPSRLEAPTGPGRLTAFGSETELRTFMRDRPRSPLTDFRGFSQFSGTTAGYVFGAPVLSLRNEALALRELGRLRAEPARALTDACRASCVDWYGNARPLFPGGRIFALLGDEIVEGGPTGHRLDELRRLDFAPPPAALRSEAPRRCAHRALTSPPQARCDGAHV